MAAYASTLITLLPTLKEVVSMCSENLSATKNKTARSNQEKFTFKLAARYGNLTSDAVKRMDDELKVMISVTIRSIKELKVLSWENVLGCMMQNPTLEQMQESSIVKADDFEINEFSVFNVDGSADDDVVMKVQVWLTNLIADKDILKEDTESIKIMAKIVAETGASVTGALSLIVNCESEKRDFIDVGILRYPDIDSPYFKLYRIHLFAWRECTRVLMVQHDSNGIRGEFNCMKFQPRDSFIAKLSEEATTTAVADMEAFILGKSK